MTREELWQQIIDQNPSFAGEENKITLTGKGLRKLFDLAYNQAYEQGKSVGSASEQLKRRTGDLMSMFNDAMRGKHD
jgi:hypothetical protein